MLSFQLFFKEKRGTMYDPEVLRNLYLDFKNSKEYENAISTKFLNTTTLYY